MSYPDDLETKYPNLYHFIQGSQHQKNGESYDRTVNKKLSIVQVSEGQLVCAITPTMEECNMLGNVHGGCMATLIDVCSTWAIKTMQGKHPWVAGGVSTDIHVQYVSAARMGVPLLIESEVVKLGESLAFMRVRVMEKDNGRMCALGTHTKFNIDSKLNLNAKL
ncbi:HotDog domain-containing protein [Endogone sp. FLAS-F59071]|nr:HotDog domain-containing protein [Endogone sp. FLAS-F59071]|eukprot:RUS13305.1 HotDog domain-containing protein [Endogone sp. FLAS-F59071]